RCGHVASARMPSDISTFAPPAAESMRPAKTRPRTISAAAERLGLIDSPVISRFSFDRTQLARLVHAPHGRALPAGWPHLQSKRIGEAQQRVFEHREPEAIHDRPAVPLSFDEPGLIQHAKVRGHRGLRYREVIRKLTGSHGPLAE